MNDFILDIVSHLSSLLQGSTIWTAGASVREFGAVVTYCASCIVITFLHLLITLMCFYWIANLNIQWQLNIVV